MTTDKLSNEGFSLREEIHKVVSSYLEDSSLSLEQVAAIASNQDLLFGFTTHFETYGETRKALGDGGAASCIYTGSLIQSFMASDTLMPNSHMELCREAFLRASHEAGQKFLERGDDKYMVDGAQLHYLAETVYEVEKIAWLLKGKGLLQ